MDEYTDIINNIVEEIQKIIPASFLLSDDFEQVCRKSEFWGRWNFTRTKIRLNGNNFLASPKENLDLLLENICRELGNNSYRLLYKFISLIIGSYCEQEKKKVDLSNLHVLLSSIGVAKIAEIEKYDLNAPMKSSLIANTKIPDYSNDDAYKAILKHIYTLCKDYERHESAYKGKHEEDLRDLIVPSLNSVFTGSNSSAETFNRTGKTDIITKAPDGNNVFIAECKVWRGEKMFSEAIDQLLGYVTWRDTRTALILFVKNSGITEIIEKAKSTIAQHPCYVNYKTQTGESSFSYIFHTKDDAQSQIALELMIFHYPE